MSLSALNDAYARRDPRLAEYIVKLAQLDPAPEGIDKAQKAGKFTYVDLVNALSRVGRRGFGEFARLARSLKELPDGFEDAAEVSFSFGSVKRSEIRNRIAKLHKGLWGLLEGEENAPFLPERVQLDGVIMRLWGDESAYARATLLEVIRFVPLKYGPWRALKKIFKESVERRDWEVFGALAAKFDEGLRRSGGMPPSVRDRTPRSGFQVSQSRKTAWDPTRRTLAYLTRRAWRELRFLGQSEPGLYVEVAVEVLRHYGSDTSAANGTWVLNHLLYHDVGRYGEASFSVGWRERRDVLENRGFVRLWREETAFGSLLRLLESSPSNFIRTFAAEALKEDFADRLGALSPDLLMRMARSDATALHEFIAWWFEEKALVSQDAYIEEGLHHIIIALLESGSSTARAFAIRFVKAYKHQLVEDIPLERVLWLVHHEWNDLHQLGLFLLDPEDSPYTIDLAAWTELLDDRRTFQLARKAVLKISAVEGLSLDWYKERLHSRHSWVMDFAFELLEDPRRQKKGEDWLGFYVSLLDPRGLNRRVAEMALDNLQQVRGEGDARHRFLDELDVTFRRALLVHSQSSVYRRLFQWVNEEIVTVEELDVSFLQGLISSTEWDEKGWASEAWLGAYLERWDLGDRYYDYSVGSFVRGLLSNPSKVGLEALGVDWVIERAERAERGNSDYEFAKTVFMQQLPLSALASEPGSDDAVAEGTRALIALLGLGRGAEEDVARPPTLYRQLFTERYNTLRRHRDPNAELFGEGLAIPESSLSFALFKEMSEDSDPLVRRLATVIGDLELSRWAQSGEITFADLYEIFTTGVEAMCDYMRKAVSSNPKSATCKIDLEGGGHFTTTSFFDSGFLHASSSRARDFGITVLKTYPEKFGRDTAALLSYADSADRRVREMVVRALWVNYRRRAVTRGEEDYGKKKARVGSEAPSDPVEHAETLVELLRQVVFRLPATHPIKLELGRSTAVTPTWRNKVALVETLRDIAAGDAEFAAQVSPLFVELLGSYGKTEHEACIVALTRLAKAHPELGVWGGDEA